MDNNTGNWKKQEIENRAKEKLASLSKEEIEDKAKKYKKFANITYSIFLALFFIGVIATILVILEPTEEPMPVASIIFVFLIYGAGIIGPLIGIYLVSKKPLEELALLEVKREIKKICRNYSKRERITAKRELGKKNEREIYCFEINGYCYKRKRQGSLKTID